MSALADFPRKKKEIKISLLSVHEGNVNQHFFKNKSVCVISMLFEINNKKNLLYNYLGLLFIFFLIVIIKFLLITDVCSHCSIRPLRFL